MKRALPIEKTNIILDQHAAAPLYRQLYERLRAQILAGQLEMGVRLPSTRVLASELGVSRNTTALAYELLLLEGYIESRVGDGTRVARLQSSLLRQAGKSVKKPSRQPGVKSPLAQRGQALLDAERTGDIYSEQATSGTNPFRVGQPDVTHFPYELWARLVAKQARQALPDVASYQHAQGYLPLRAAIATHIGITRGVQCTPEQLILTSGSQGALDLVARTLLDPGQSAWVEDPGYMGARGALLAAEARLIPVPVDEQGLNVEAGRQLSSSARLVIVTPSHQFPSAVTMSLGRRLELLEWSRAAQSWIIEDDYDSEYRFSGRPLQALQGLDNSERVIYIGTFSKVLFPSLRLGYLVVPPALLPGLNAVRRLIDVHPPLLEQLALTDFIVEGHFARYLRKMRAMYLERRNTLITALTQELGGLLEITTPEAGMHLVAWLPQDMSGEYIIKQTTQQGLPILSLSTYSLRPLQRDALVLGFATSTPKELQTGVQKLARALRGRS
ncbi:GntR family transcriptional regulator [Dictyobacter alpinus]|uniref:GntR family transcriptional regulator n=2 Tax=Dictyobacter alpinus TaxID=2014873 RepID=A0A402BBY4_9CHLR|nr:GntR family transcriptional regulator [Dictyobacter alpinus]